MGNRARDRLYYSLGAFAGAAAITFLLSRLGLWLTKRWNGGFIRILAVHLVCLAIVVVLSAFGHADDGPPNWTAAAVYAFAQAAWMVFDLLTSKQLLRSDT